MKQFEYEITTHLAETFTHVTYFCNEEGDCAIHQVPEEQVRLLTGILNDRGRQGWELMQLAFGKGGLMAFWKRGIKANTSSKTKRKRKLSTRIGV